MHHQHDVTGDEAHQKSKQHGHDQHHGSVAVICCRAGLHAVPQCSEKQNIRHHDHYTRDQEHHQSHEDEVVVRQLHRGERVERVLDDVDIVAGGDVGVFELCGVVVQVQRRAGDPDESPDGHANTDRHFVVLPLMGQRVSHHPVPLHTEAGDEKHGAVHVPIEEAHKDFAQRLPVDPVVAVKMVLDF